MIAAAIIVFREVLEAALVIGIVLAATRGLLGSARYVLLGVFGGLFGAAIVAKFAGALSDAMQGYGQEMFNASVLLVAVAMLIWHNTWMTSHGREMAREMRGVGQAVQGGEKPLYALAIVVGVAVLREGAETVLFLYGLAASGGGLTVAVTGGAIGLLIGALVGSILYFGLLRIPTRHLFTVTTWMISLLAAGMAAQAMVYLSAADVLSLGNVLWDTSWLISERSVPGKVLHTLIGYMDQPTLVQVAAYVATLLVIAGGSALSGWRMRQGNVCAVTR